MNRERRQALRTLLLDRVEPKVEKIHAKRTADAAKATKERDALQNKLFKSAVKGGRWRLSARWGNEEVSVERPDGCNNTKESRLEAEVRVKLNATDVKRLDALEATMKAGEKKVDIEAQLKVLMAEVTLWDAKKINNQFDSLIAKLMKRIEDGLK